jgi:hypothetical protein
MTYHAIFWTMRQPMEEFSAFLGFGMHSSGLPGLFSALLPASTRR